MKARLRDLLIGCGALAYGDFVLSSGKRSPYYIDLKRAVTDPGVLEAVSEELAKLLQDEQLEFDRIAGVVLGSVPLAVALSLRTKAPYVMVRRGQRDHGTLRTVEGTMVEGDRILVVEDVITSAASVADAVATLRAGGAIVKEVVAVVDRQEGGRERLGEEGVRLLSLLTARDLLGARGGD